jgi:hypothetical protein
MNAAQFWVLARLASNALVTNGGAVSNPVSLGRAPAHGSVYSLRGFLLHRYQTRDNAGLRRYAPLEPLTHPHHRTYWRAIPKDSGWRRLESVEAWWGGIG